MDGVATHYINRIQKSLDLMQVWLADGKSPALEDLAEAAHISKFHFHRIYRLVTGETCQQTITRLKLTIAAANLQDNQVSITEAAMNAGFSSSQALAKALKRELTLSASQLKSEPERLSNAIATLSKPDPVKTHNNLLSIELTSLEPFTFIAIPTEGKYPELSILYSQLFEIAGGPENVKAILGVPELNADLLDADNAIFDCALLLESNLNALPDQVVEKQLLGGDYVRLRHIGSFAGLDKSLDKAYQFLLSQDNASVSDSPCLFHYLDDPEEVEENQLRTDVYLPVKLLS